MVARHSPKGFAWAQIKRFRFVFSHPQESSPPPQYFFALCFFHIFCLGFKVGQVASVRGHEVFFRVLVLFFRMKLAGRCQPRECRSRGAAVYSCPPPPLARRRRSKKFHVGLRRRLVFHLPTNSWPTRRSACGPTSIFGSLGFFGERQPSFFCPNICHLLANETFSAVHNKRSHTNTMTFPRAKPRPLPPTRPNDLGV